MWDKKYFIGYFVTWTQWTCWGKQLFSPQTSFSPFGCDRNHGMWLFLCC